MKDSVLISIKPAFAELIVEGIKRVELRRSFPVSNIGKKCFIYSSSPTQAVIGDCLISNIEKLSIEELWSKYSDTAMICWDDFKSYFEGKEFGYAISISKPKRYEKSVDLKNNFDLSRPPQSFCYI